MPTAENGQIKMEMGQTLVPFTALTDSGDHISFNAAHHLLSRADGKEPEIIPDGVASGLQVTVGVSGSNNKVDVSAGYVYLAGVLTSISAAADETVVRASDPETHSINSIQVTALGAVAVITGTEGSAFSETRGAAGGPPYIVVGSIEIAQVRLSSFTAAVVTADEIFQVPGTHRELSTYPGFVPKYSRVENGILCAAGADMNEALPLSHTAGVPKKIYAKYYSPIFSTLGDTDGFVPAETTHSVSSKQIYRKALGAVSGSVGQGAFTAYLQNGIDDAMLAWINQKLWFKFYQDYTNTGRYVLTQGKLGVSRQFPAGDNIAASCTVSAEEASQSVTAEASL